MYVRCAKEKEAHDNEGGVRTFKDTKDQNAFHGSQRWRSWNSMIKFVVLFILICIFLIPVKVNFKTASYVIPSHLVISVCDFSVKSFSHIYNWAFILALDCRYLYIIKINISVNNFFINISFFLCHPVNHSSLPILNYLIFIKIKQFIYWAQ